MSLENIINDLNDRLFSVEEAIVESRKAMLLVLKKVDFLLGELEDDVNVEMSKQMKNHPFSVYIEEYFNHMMEMDSGLDTLKELERELEKYSDEITGLGES